MSVTCCFVNKMASASKLDLQRISDLCNDSDVREVQKVEVAKKGIEKIADLSSCEALKRLDVSRNSLSSLKGIAGCMSLTWLNVANNNLKRLKGVENLVNLSVLNASHNSISATGNLSTLRNLKALILSHNALTDIQGLESMRHLNSLVLSSNQLEVVEVCMLTSLEKLSLSHNRLQHIPDTSRNKKLKELRVNENQISHVPPTMQENTLLQLCDLGNNSIRKWKSVSVLCQLNSLKSLNLKGNKLCSRENYGEKVRMMFSWVDVLDGHKQSTASSRKEPASDSKSQFGRQSDDPAVQDGKSSKSAKPKHRLPNVAGGRLKPDADDSGEDGARVNRTKPQSILKPRPVSVNEQVLQVSKGLSTSSGDTGSKKMSLPVPQSESGNALLRRKRKHSTLNDSQAPVEVSSSVGGLSKERAETTPAEARGRKAEAQSTLSKKQKLSKPSRKQSGIVKVKHVKKHRSRPACSPELLQSVLNSSSTDLLGAGRTLPSW